MHAGQERPTRVMDLSTVVGPSRWWELLAAADDVLRTGGGTTLLVEATSDDGERVSAEQVDEARRSIARWDGDLDTLTVVRADDPTADGYRVRWSFARGVAPRVEISGPDEAELSSLASAVRNRVTPLAESMAAEDAQAVPPGRAGRIWRRMDTLGTVIAVGISVVIVLAVAGSVWAWWSSR